MAARPSRVSLRPAPARNPAPARYPVFALYLAFWVYTAGLLVWLALGLLPTLAESFPAVHRWLEGVSTGDSAVAGAAMRVLMADPMTGAVPVWEALLQYGFSLLNLGLGVLLFVRRHDRLVPRLLAFALLGTAATFNGPSHRAFHITGAPWPIALIHFTFHVTSGACYLWAVVLFPNGDAPRQLRRIPGPRWLWPIVLTVVAAVICWRSSFIDHPVFFVVFFGIAVALGGSVAQILRLLDPATPVRERATARLLIAGLLPALATSLVWVVARVVSWWVPGNWFEHVATTVQDTFPVVFALVPVVLVVGLVRYGWWNIDRLLSRVLVYGVIGGVTGLVYVVAVAAGGSLIGGGLWWTVLALAAAAAAFDPMRRIAGRWANRVVYGQLTSPVQAMRSLVSGLEQLSPAGGLSQVETVTVQATRARSAALWLIDGERLVRPTGGDEEWIPLPDGDRSPAVVARALGADSCWEVTHVGLVLGFFAVHLAPDTRLRAADTALIADVAAHAGLLLHNALLGVQLARQVSELAAASRTLQASRRRLVAAQDEERRRLERDLHDGAQQALVAALIGVRTLRTGPEALGDIASLVEVLEAAANWLTEMTTDDRPPVLARYGLEGALLRAARLAEASGVRTTVTVRRSSLETSDLSAQDLRPPGIPQQRRGAHDDAFDPARSAEIAVYFCCLEAMQNVAKYADASHIEVEVISGEQEVRFAVTDDGRGFDPGDVLGESSGIPQLVHRLALLGGVLMVDSAPGHGTRLRGSVPVRVEAAAVAAVSGAGHE